MGTPVFEMLLGGSKYGSTTWAGNDRQAVFENVIKVILRQPGNQRIQPVD